MIIIETLLGGYKEVELPVKDAIKMLRLAGERRGMTRDILEAIRILENFDEFYRVQQKRNRAYLTPPKDSKDLLFGKAFIDKLKLLLRSDEKLVKLMFDRRVSGEEIKDLLFEIGYEEVVVK